MQNKQQSFVMCEPFNMTYGISYMNHASWNMWYLHETKSVQNSTVWVKPGIHTTWSDPFECGVCTGLDMIFVQ